MASIDGFQAASQSQEGGDYRTFEINRTIASSRVQQEDANFDPSVIDQCEKYATDFIHNFVPVTSQLQDASDRRPYSCRFCDKRFCHPSKLHRHERIHTCDRPYACRFCHKSFAQAGNRLRHERIHTGNRASRLSVLAKDG